MQAMFLDFHHFQAGSVDFDLVLVRHCVWGIFKSDAPDSTRFKGDTHSFPLKTQTLKGKR